LKARPHPAARPIEQDKVRSQLLKDLDKFVERFDREEQMRIKAEEQAQLRKEEEMRRWSEEQARKREAFERTLGPTAIAELSRTGTMRRETLDMLKKQSAAQPQKDDAGVAHAKSIAALDATMRNTFHYLVELARELNSLTPSAEQPYEFIYLGKLPAVTLAEASVDHRLRYVQGKEVYEHLSMRFRIRPSTPAKAKVLGPDITSCGKYLNALKIPFTKRADAKDDFGKVTRAEFTVSGSLPCEITVRADFEANAVHVDLTNVRRLGRVQQRFTPEQFHDAVDDLARYVLGVDRAFERLGSR
jgi:hypothetical protein